MSDDMLTQEEINALLNGPDLDSNEEDISNSDEGGIEEESRKEEKGPKTEEIQERTPTPTTVSEQKVPNQSNDSQPTTKVDELRYTDPQPFSSPQLSKTENHNLNMLLDINLDIIVELGRTRQSIKDILHYSKGSIVELDKLAEEPVDILVNNKLVAKGEVVVVDDNFGVKVTEIISKEERILNLGS